MLATQAPSGGRRVVLLDTETTGLDPAAGHRIVELACIELVNLMPTGRELHFYCNPGRDMPEEAFAVHGLSAGFLSGHPSFAEQAERLLAFIGDAEAVVAHNAEFDLRFIEWELAQCGRRRLGCAVVDTLQLARRRFPGAPASLDALCRRFAIDLAERTRHGALIDTRLLARVYLELMGGQQPGLELAARTPAEAAAQPAGRPCRTPRPHAASEAELAAHQAMLAGLEDPLWLRP